MWRFRNEYNNNNNNNNNNNSNNNNNNNNIYIKVLDEFVTGFVTCSSR